MTYVFLPVFFDITKDNFENPVHFRNFSTYYNNMWEKEHRSNEENLIKSQHTPMFLQSWFMASIFLFPSSCTYAGGTHNLLASFRFVKFSLLNS
jgi:hypothetical protein